eukprot:2042719-Lingulodinium_polyedra.AAC.1
MGLAWCTVYGAWCVAFCVACLVCGVRFAGRRVARSVRRAACGVWGDSVLWLLVFGAPCTVCGV